MKVFTWKAPDPKAKDPYGRATFNTPVLVDGRLYCRNVHGEVACFDLSGRLFGRTASTQDASEFRTGARLHSALLARQVNASFNCL